MPEDKGRGLGYGVTLAALYAIRESGQDQAFLTTDDQRFSAIVTYRRLGFAVVDNHPSVAGRWQTICRARGTQKQAAPEADGDSSRMPRTRLSAPEGGNPSFFGG
jgi:hypothetical protein